MDKTKNRVGEFVFQCESVVPQAATRQVSVASVIIISQLVRYCRFQLSNSSSFWPGFREKPFLLIMSLSCFLQLKVSFRREMMSLLPSEVTQINLFNYFSGFWLKECFGFAGRVIFSVDLCSFVFISVPFDERVSLGILEVNVSDIKLISWPHTFCPRHLCMYCHSLVKEDRNYYC